MKNRFMGISSARPLSFRSCTHTHNTLRQPWPTRRTMVADSPSVFRPFLQEFFVKASDPLFTCTLKLDVLTALVTKENCATILGELQTYVLHRDKSFVCAAVRAVGRVADARPDAADQCLHVSTFSWSPKELEKWISAAMLRSFFLPAADIDFHLCGGSYPSCLFHLLCMTILLFTTSKLLHVQAS